MTSLRSFAFFPALGIFSGAALMWLLSRVTLGVLRQGRRGDDLVRGAPGTRDARRDADTVVRGAADTQSGQLGALGRDGGALGEMAPGVLRRPADPAGHLGRDGPGGQADGLAEVAERDIHEV